MTIISAALVKELREKTNAAMMECKKALTEADGDMDKAIDILRMAGQAKAVKKASLQAAEGRVVVLGSADGTQAVLVEVNCQTDFVAREEKFKNFVQKVAQKALALGAKAEEKLSAETDAERLELVVQLGENISVRRVAFCETSAGVVGAYGHGDANGVRIGALVVLSKGPVELARDLAMQVAAMNPEYLRTSDVPAARLEKEKEIFLVQTREKESDKSEDMIQKIVAGKLGKFSKEVTLLGQPFVKDPTKTVEALLKESGAEIQSFVRFMVGEGVEKKEDNFVAEVMAQVRG